MKQFSNLICPKGFTLSLHPHPLREREGVRGFTLIELLVVIAILGILAVAVVTALNIVGNLNKGTLARAKTFNASVENALSINQVGKWSFEDGAGSTSFKDISGYNNNGSCSGTSCPTWKTAIDCGLGYGGCLEFDGTDDYVDRSPRTWGFSTTVTVTAWIKTTDVFGSIVSLGHSDKNDELLLYLRNDNKIGIFNHKAGGNYRERRSSTVVSDGKWHFVAGVLDGGSACENLHIFVDGVKEIGTCVTDGSPTDIVDTTPRNLRFGARHNATTGSEMYSGLLDEVQIYNQALLSSQIQQLYAQGSVRHVLAFR